MRAQADVAQGVAWRVEALKLDGLANLDHIAGLHAPVHAGDFAGRLVVRDDLGASGGDHRRIAASVVMVLVGVENLRDLPAFDFGGCQRFFGIQRVGLIFTVFLSIIIGESYSEFNGMQTLRQLMILLGPTISVFTLFPQPTF